MTVLVHPVLARAANQAELKAMQAEFGLVATTTGHLVLPNGQHPAMRPSKPKRLLVINSPYPTGPFNGGGAAA